MLETGASIGPHPGEPPLAVFSLSPNGSVVAGWSAELTHRALADIDAELLQRPAGPGPVVAVPHFSGSTSPSLGGRSSRGALLGITLATSAADITQALMEGIAFDLAATFTAFRQAGAELNMIRATGGGTRSRWWTQLKADLTGLPIEVVDQPEPGTLGAALLAGVAVGAYDSIAGAARTMRHLVTRYDPDATRAGRYAERQSAYNGLAARLPRPWEC
jgi:xylulokinase